MEALAGGQAQRVGEGGEHGHRGVTITPLLKPGEVFDADPGERGQFGTAKAGGTAPPPPGSPTSAGVTASRQARRNSPKVVSLTFAGYRAVSSPSVALRGPVSARPPSGGPCRRILGAAQGFSTY
ncbi:hypothetical protein GCM10027612_25050 [Microbispora bryophytorum subsp. camponoti]